MYGLHWAWDSVSRVEEVLSLSLSKLVKSRTYYTPAFVAFFGTNLVTIFPQFLFFLTTSSTFKSRLLFPSLLALDLLLSYDRGG
jgi:hypothetical protein